MATEVHSAIARQLGSGARVYRKVQITLVIATGARCVHLASAAMIDVVNLGASGNELQSHVCGGW